MDESSLKEQYSCPPTDNEQQQQPTQLQQPQQQPTQMQQTQQQPVQSETETSIGTSAPAAIITASSASFSATETTTTVNASSLPSLPEDSFSPDMRETTPMGLDTTSNLPPSPSQAQPQPQMEQQPSSIEQNSRPSTDNEQSQQQQHLSEPSTMLFGFTTNARTSGPSITKNNILEAIKDFDSSIPDAVVHHFLNVADSLQHCKLRGVQAKKTKEKKYTLAIEDLASALAEYGIECPKMDEASSKEQNSRPATDNEQLQQQQQPSQQQQPQQQQLQSENEASIGTSSAPTTNTTASSSSPSSATIATINASNLSSLPEELFSPDRWGTTPIRQDTPWQLPPSPTQPQSQPQTQTQQHHSSDSFHGQPMVVNNAINLVSGGPSSSFLAAAAASRFEQPNLRAPFATNNKPSLATSASFANHNFINPTTSGLQGSVTGPTAFGAGVGLQHTGDEFARAPGPNSSILDSNTMTPKPFGISQRNSTWSSFGAPTGTSDSDSEWPKTTTAGISKGSNSSQQPNNAFDLVHEFEPGAYSFASPRSPTGANQHEASGIGTWSPIVKGTRPGSMWDGDGSDRRGDNGRFDDGTAIWGSPAQSKASGIEWDKSGDGSGNIDKTRSSAMAGNNQSNYRNQQSSSSTSLLMSSNAVPQNPQNRNQQALKPSLSHNFDQVQQQSNALSGQPNQQNRGLGLSSNVPSKHQLTTMVQQIQLAVQAGHLNPQILNQPLAPITLQLLYQLLQHIRQLQQLQMKFNQPGSHQAAVSVQMTKTKQNILTLQNQIAAQQAMHLKQQNNIMARQPTQMPNLVTGDVGGGMGPTLPPGISQSGDSLRPSTSVGDFHDQVNCLMPSRFNHPWRAVSKQTHQTTSMASSFSSANHNLMNLAPGGMPKLNSGNGGGSLFVDMQQNNEFARAPGSASSMMDNSMTLKPFGSVANRSSTWSAFGNSGPNEPEAEWPKTTSSTISANATSQSSNAFDLVPEFEPGKPWRGSMLMRSVEDDPTMTPGSMARSIAPQRKTIWSDEIL